MIKTVINFFFSLLAGLLLSLPAMAVETDVVKKTSLDAFSMMNMLNMLMGLAVVVALILGLAWVLKKYGKVSGSNVVDMKILGGLSLGTREKAILIEVDNTRLLVGVTPGHIQTLHVLGDNKAVSASFNETLNTQINKAQLDQTKEQSNA